MKFSTCSLAAVAVAALLLVSPRADAAVTSKLGIADQGNITQQTATSTSKHKTTKHGQKGKHAQSKKSTHSKQMRSYRPHAQQSRSQSLQSRQLNAPGRME